MPRAVKDKENQAFLYKLAYKICHKFIIPFFRAIWQKIKFFEISTNFKLEIEFLRIQAKEITHMPKDFYTTIVTGQR